MSHTTAEPKIEKENEAFRLSVNLAPEVAKVLKEMASSSGMTISEIVRRAIATEQFLLEEQAAGSKFLLQEDDGSIKRVVLR